MKRKIFAILAFLLCVTSVHAAVGQAVIDGMNYALSTDGEVRTATLLAGDKKYAGRVVIPSIVTFAGNQYKVTAVGNDAFKECTGLKSITFIYISCLNCSFFFLVGFSLPFSLYLLHILNIDF